jgi:glycerate kinase
MALPITHDIGGLLTLREVVGPVAGHVVIAPDKFKGSLTAPEVAAAVARGLQAAAPGVEVLCLPVADGGDGTVDAAIAAGYLRVTRWVTGPTGKPVSASIAVRGDTAVVEMAAASGLVVLPEGRLEPLTATSAGTGDLLRIALDLGCRRIVLGVGGSACTDGGEGMLVALGARVDQSSVDLSGLDERLRGVDFVLASDVDNPLLGSTGAAAVYGPQKGASPADVEVLEARLDRWADLIGREHADAPGAGAAGGVGFAALAVLGARRRSGIEVLLELVGFPQALPGARLVVTGEGSLDEQTLNGKAPAGVAAAAGGVPVVAVAGRCLLKQEALQRAGISAAYALLDIEPDPGRCFALAGPLLERLAGRVAREWLPTGAHDAREGG